MLTVAQAWPSYYEVIKKEDAISISQIAQKMRAGPLKGYQDLRDFAADWQRLFHNVRTFNTPGSDIYRYADELQEVFKAQLKESAHRHHVLGDEEL